MLLKGVILEGYESSGGQHNFASIDKPFKSLFKTLPKLFGSSGAKQYPVKIRAEGMTGPTIT